MAHTVVNLVGVRDSIAIADLGKGKGMRWMHSVEYKRKKNGS